MSGNEIRKWMNLFESYRGINEDEINIDNDRRNLKIFDIDDTEDDPAGGEVFDTTKASVTLSEKAQQILGENGVQRYEQFKLYVAGWDSGNGQVLSSHSTAILEKFLNTFDSFPDEPSIFFTRNGNLQLGWEDLQSNVLELEFFPDKIEYYIASNDEEGEVDTSQDSIARFCDMLSSL